MSYCTERFVDGRGQNSNDQSGNMRYLNAIGDLTNCKKVNLPQNPFPTNKLSEAAKLLIKFAEIDNPYPHFTPDMARLFWENMTAILDNDKVSYEHRFKLIYINTKIIREKMKLRDPISNIGCQTKYIGQFQQYRKEMLSILNQIMHDQQKKENAFIA